MSFLDSQKKTEQYLRQAMGLQPASTPMTDWAKMMLGTLNPAAWSIMSPAAAMPTAPAATANAGPAAASAGKDPLAGPALTEANEQLLKQLTEMRREVAQLQSRLAQKQKKRQTAG